MAVGAGVMRLRCPGQGQVSFLVCGRPGDWQPVLRGRPCAGLRVSGMIERMHCHVQDLQVPASGLIGIAVPAAACASRSSASTAAGNSRCDSANLHLNFVLKCMLTEADSPFLLNPMHAAVLSYVLSHA